MDISLFIGILIGAASIIVVLVSDSGSVSSLLEPSAALIVFGGTFGAGIVNFSFSTIEKAFQDVLCLIGLLETRKRDSARTVKQVLELANIARQEGTLVFESVAENIDDMFLKKALRLLLDTNNSKHLEEILKCELEAQEEIAHESPHVFESLGGYAPTFGIIGAVVGLIHVMGNIENVEQLGKGISTAFIATLYGVGAANLVFIPLAGRLRMHFRDRLLLNKAVAEGIISIHRCENPSITKEKILSSLRI